MKKMEPVTQFNAKQRSFTRTHFLQMHLKIKNILEDYE